MKIITLCGSTRFKEEYIKVQRDLTLQGNIVISVGLFGHDMSGETKKMLDELHLRKIDISDEIFVINVGGYIGSSTSKEIEYAKNHGKVVNYLEKKLYKYQRGDLSGTIRYKNLGSNDIVITLDNNRGIWHVPEHVFHKEWVEI